MGDTIWAAIWGAAAGAGFAYLAAKRQRVEAQRAQIIDEARREVAPKLDDYGHWLVRVRQVFVDLYGEDGEATLPDTQRYALACNELEKAVAERERYAEQLRTLRYYRVPLAEYADLADELLAAHAKLGELLDMAWMYFRFDVQPAKCQMLATMMMAALGQYAVLTVKTRDSVLDDVLRPMFHPFAGRWDLHSRRRRAKREKPIDFNVEPHSQDWDLTALQYKEGRWIIGQRLLLHHPDLQALLDEEWEAEPHVPREHSAEAQGA